MKAAERTAPGKTLTAVIELNTLHLLNPVIQVFA